MVSITKFSKMFIYTFMYLDEFKKISDFKDQIIDKKFKIQKIINLIKNYMKIILMKIIIIMNILKI